MSKNKELVVTTSGNRSLDEVKKDLSDAGFKIDLVLDEIGCITGVGDDKVEAKLRRIPGVADVSDSPPPINIGPPGSPIS